MATLKKNITDRSADDFLLISKQKTNTVQIIVLVDAFLPVHSVMQPADSILKKLGISMAAHTALQIFAFSPISRKWVER